MDKIIAISFILLYNCAGQKQNLDPKIQSEPLPPSDIKSELVVTDFSLDSQLDNLTNQIIQSLANKQKTKIAVIEFSDLNGNITEFGKYLSEELITRLFLTDRFEVVERNMLNKILEEQQLNMSGLVDEDTIKELGRILGVDAIASGSITDLGGNVKVNARLISTETGAVFSVASVKIIKDQTVKMLLDKLPVSHQFLPSPNKASNTISSNNKSKFNVDLSKYDVGDLIDEIGTDLMVAERGGKKYIQGLNDTGKLTINNLVLKNKFEIEFSADWKDFTQTVLIQSEDGDEIKLMFKGYLITFGNTAKKYSKTSWKSGKYYNDCRIFVKDKVAKLFLNEEFFGTVQINPNVTYTKLIIRGIKMNDELRDISGTNL